MMGLGSFKNVCYREDFNIQLLSSSPEVEFAHAVTAGGSVKFLPAV